jgi:hypothetical protein
MLDILGRCLDTVLSRAGRTVGGGVGTGHLPDVTVRESRSVPMSPEPPVPAVVFGIGPSGGGVRECRLR